MLKTLRALLRHEAWADAEHWRALEACPSALASPEILERLNHINLAQRGHDLVVGWPRQLSFLNQERVILANVLGAELLGGAMKALSEFGDVPDVAANGLGRVVSPLEFFQHALSNMGHNAS